ncbi:alpha/beta hydrolase fold family protein [Mycobacterium kansasii]|uniref:Alpha/beta hydrolase fold family protein n=1 Tax=Mycobacterium kansasii TaxID=1768 RepID=A0A1V3WRL8_MYCKA|nr:alpha/beta hydrolase fold family protein [Mycobacterium kansasii]
MPVIRALIALTSRGTSSDVEVITLGSGAGVRLYQGVGVTEPRPALLWIHGGGYVLGKAAQDDRLCRRFTRALGITVASVEYRLAPEHPYPAPLEDCYSALCWLAALPAVDPDRIAIGGASAGGGLAAALALLARDRGEIAPAFQLLSYPMLDDRSSATAANPRYRLWDARANRFGWAAYLGDADPGWPSRADVRTCAAWRRRGSASAPTTCFTMRISAMPDGWKTPGCPARSTWCRARSTASTW